MRPDDGTAKAGLNKEFGEHFSITHTDRGRWWAFRLPMVGETPAQAVDLDADTAAELAEKLRGLGGMP